ncbi:hypothetical protein Btru_015627 [Bulinus truncatus]|nr:hypothetical protein Btru_015627 [Bulinus truncatus]
MDSLMTLLAECSKRVNVLWYSTPPPLWPRRLCDLKFFSCTKNCWITLAAVLLCYFLVMDVILFSRYNNVQLSLDSVVGKDDEVYSPFTHLSVKGLLNDHPSQFIIAPSSEYFDAVTHFSSTFSFITPTMISYSHLLCGFISGKFLASDNIQDRRIGVLLYEVRTWLDAFDGTVYRAQAGLRLKYHSNHSSSGYFTDSLFDTIGGCFLCLSIYYYLTKRFCLSGAEQPARPKPSPEEGTTQDTDRSHRDGSPARRLLLITFLFGLSLAVAGKSWDLAVDEFTNVFEFEFKDPTFSALQYSISHSNVTLVIFYLWRLFGGQSVLNYVLIAIFMDKTWEFLQYMPYVLMGISSLLYLVTFIYIQQVSSDLHI